MEKSNISIFERLDTISHIMPYYAHTHKVFLLLSRLCSSSRWKLDKYYDGFIRLMKENWIKIDWNLNGKYLFLPSDLYIKDIRITDTHGFYQFVKFIKNLNESKGWYFKNHFMHSQIKVEEKVKVNIDWIESLYAYYEIIKSIQVWLSNNLNQLVSLDITEYSNWEYKII